MDFMIRENESIILKHTHIHTLFIVQGFPQLSILTEKQAAADLLPQLHRAHGNVAGREKVCHFTLHSLLKTHFLNKGIIQNA